MSESESYLFTLESAEFFSVGRALQRGFGKSAIGRVALEVRDGTLTIEAKCGGGQIACEGEGEISATVAALAFCTLITTRFREKAPSGTMRLVFCPAQGEIAVDRAGVKARF